MGGGAVLAAVEGLIAELRAIGVPVSLSEGIDAVRVLPHVRLGDREEVRVALRAALVKRHEHEHAFDTVFDLFFSPAAAPPADPEEEEPRETPGAPGAMAPGESIATLDDERLIGLLVEALRAEDFTTVRLIAGIFVDRHARIEPGRPVGGTYYLFRTMLAIDQDALL